MGAKFEAKLSALYDMLAIVHTAAEDAGFDPIMLSQIELVAEEALVNIISYAYKSEEENGSLEIDTKKLENPPGLEIALIDFGSPFNPLDYNVQKNPLIDQSIGGYGIFFIKKFMDKLDYERVDNRNIFRLTKMVPKEGACFLDNQEEN